jgi:hypothetical protein
MIKQIIAYYYESNGITTKPVKIIINLDQLKLISKTFYCLF